MLSSAHQGLIPFALVLFAQHHYRITAYQSPLFVENISLFWEDKQEAGERLLIWLWDLRLIEEWKDLLQMFQKAPMRVSGRSNGTLQESRPCLWMWFLWWCELASWQAPLTVLLPARDHELSTLCKWAHIIVCHIKLGASVATANSFMPASSLSRLRSLFPSHTRSTDEHTNKHTCKNRQLHRFRFLGKKNKLPHIPPLSPVIFNGPVAGLGHTQLLCHCRAEEGVRSGGGLWGGLVGLQGPGMLIGKIVLIRPSSSQMLGEG